MFCAIDFGTSNSAIAVPCGASMELVELESGQLTMPTAVFYRPDPGPHGAPPCEFGRAALAAYVDGVEGRWMRSMKSLLGSSLIEQTTEVGGGRRVERGLTGHQCVLVADIGGGTCDFAVVRVGPGRASRADRKDEFLAHLGVHRGRDRLRPPARAGKRAAALRPPLARPRCEGRRRSARGAERDRLRSGDLAPHQHRVRARARRAAAAHAQR